MCHQVSITCDAIEIKPRCYILLSHAVNGRTTSFPVDLIASEVNKHFAEGEFDRVYCV